MKRIAFVLMIAVLLALGNQAVAELCTIDAVPAATLLLPYFEVDRSDDATGESLTTLFSINNASAAPALAHVTLWTDWSIPTIDFDVYLTGYDVQTVNLRDVFNGNLPVTADPQSDAGNTISPSPGNIVGPQPNAWDQNFPNCAGFFPFSNPVVGGNALARLQNGHTGDVVLGIGCMGADHGDDVARGYITIDSVNECSTDFPDDIGYFVDGGLGIANNSNQLWGDYFIVDAVNNFAFGESLVHVEAHDLLNAFDIPVTDPDTGATVATVGNTTGYTFYGRYTIDGADNREPLSTTWAVRYMTGAGFSGTDLIVWRDSTADLSDGEFHACGGPGTAGSGPDWHPLNETEVIAFDEEENAVELCFAGPGGVISPPEPGSDEACFPLEAQRVTVGEFPLNPPYEFGWLYLNLNLPTDAPAGDSDFGSDGNIAQSYVAAAHSADGRFEVGYTAVSLTDACQDLNIALTDTWAIPEN